ncbi:MAG: arsenate reductase family protein [Candidatus Binataceae bacterium]
MEKARFIWKSNCTTCRDARRFLLDELGASLDERDYARVPLSATELKELFAGRDPRDFLNPRSPAYKAMGLAGMKMTPARAIELMVKQQNLLKRPVVVAGTETIAGFDRDRYRAALK